MKILEIVQIMVMFVFIKTYQELGQVGSDIDGEAAMDFTANNSDIVFPCLQMEILLLERIEMTEMEIILVMYVYIIYQLY